MRLKIGRKKLYLTPTKHNNEKNVKLHPPFVLVSRMCPTPNPNKTNILVYITYLKDVFDKRKSSSYKRCSTFITRKREKLIKQK
jgi:hypothetical protein